MIRVNSGAVKTEGRFTRFNSLPGCPDLLVAMPALTGGIARFVAIEVKRPNRGVVTNRQYAAHERLRQAGALVIVARSVEDVRAALQEEGLI